MVWKWKPTLSAVSRPAARSSHGVRCIFAGQPPEECEGAVDPKPPGDVPKVPLDGDNYVVLVCDGGGLERVKYERPDDPWLPDEDDELPDEHGLAGADAPATAGVCCGVQSLRGIIA